MIAWQSLLPLITRGDQIVPAASAIAQVETIAEVGGPVAGGGLVQVIGAPAAVFVDAVSLVGSAVIVRQFDVQEEPPQAERAPILTEIRVGFQYLM